MLFYAVDSVQFYTIEYFLVFLYISKGIIYVGVF